MHRLDSSVDSVDNASSAGSVKSNGGYDAWVKTGRPVEPLSDSLFSPLVSNEATNSSTVPSYLCDDLVKIVNVLDRGSVDAPVTTSGSTSLVNTDTNTRASAATTMLKSTTNTTSTAEEMTDMDQNAAAAEYFLQQMLVSDIIVPEEDELQSSELVHPAALSISTDAVTTSAYSVDLKADNSVNMDAEPEDEMVYSRLHGYKIKVHKEQTGAIYKKILTDMGTHLASDNTTSEGNEFSIGEHDTSSRATELTANKLKQLHTISSQSMPSATVMPTHSILSTQYRSNVYAKYTQYRPLRAAACIDRASVEQQPERVIFGSDIESALFKADYTTSSSIIDASMRQKLKQSLVVRVLQALGVEFPHSTCSHGLFSRSCELNKQDIHGYLLDEAQLYDNIITSFATTPTTTSTDKMSALHSTETTLNGQSVPSYVSHLLSIGDAALPVCAIPTHLVQKHMLCARLGLDSELNFTIRIIADILSVASQPADIYSTNGNSRDKMLSAAFATQLQCVLIRLLTIRCHVELNLLNTTTATTSATTTTVTTTAASGSIADTQLSSDRIITLWRSQCRGLLATSISTVTTTTTTTTSNGEMTIPAVGHLALWAEYLQCETFLGQNVEAAKVIVFSYYIVLSWLS